MRTSPNFPKKLILCIWLRWPTREDGGYQPGDAAIPCPIYLGISIGLSQILSTSPYLLRDSTFISPLKHHGWRGRWKRQCYCKRIKRGWWRQQEYSHDRGGSRQNSVEHCEGRRWRGAQRQLCLSGTICGGKECCKMIT
ncbi:hypothetical protein GOP47_0023681, partial [Adiantum capillus-veneris]